MHLCDLLEMEAFAKEQASGRDGKRSSKAPRQQQTVETFQSRRSNVGRPCPTLQARE